MAHHAYSIVGDTEKGIEQAVSFAAKILDTVPFKKDPDIIIFKKELFSVEDARTLIYDAHISSQKRNGKVIIVSFTRIFHEAQNALLKILEEPPVGVTFILSIPSEGILLPTVRSRIISVPFVREEYIEKENIVNFIKASKEAREKIITKLLEKTKSDTDEEKQKARAQCIELVEGLMHFVYTVSKKTPKEKDTKNRTFLADCQRFLPILHERSAPLKLIFEHILITFPV
jgi:DNA polymerase III delta prime subunit